MTKRSRYAPLVLGSLLLAGGLGCNGEIGAMDEASPAPDTGSTPAPPPAAPGKGDPVVGSPAPPPPADTPRPPGACTYDVGVSSLRFLTRVEYERTVQALFRDATLTVSAVADDERVGAFQANTTTPLTETTAEIYLKEAERISERVVQNLDGIVSCATKNEACARQFLQTFAVRAFRRPVDAVEIDGFMKVFAAGNQGGGFGEGMRLLLQALLQSGSFLYRADTLQDARAGVGALDGWSLASRLSYYLWRSMPDDALFEAAATSKLSTAAEIKQQVDRMLRDPRALDTVVSFHAQWLGLDGIAGLEKDGTLFPGFAALRPAIAAETDNFLREVVWAGDGRLGTLLTSADSIIAPALAPLYGVPMATGSEPRRITFDATRRGGILTRAAFLAATSPATETNPVTRGKLIREQLLCDHLPDPPDDVDATPPAPTRNATTRERYEKLTGGPACYGCHQHMDPLGFLFEHYDAIGRFRDTENGKPVRTSVTLTGAEEANGPVSDAVELGKRLASSAKVRACVTRQWFRFALARLEHPADECTIQQLEQELSSAGDDLRALWARLPLSYAFRHGRIEASGGQP